MDLKKLLLGWRSMVPGCYKGDQAAETYGNRKADDAIPEDLSSTSPLAGSDQYVFTFRELWMITKNFSPANALREGRFGRVYMGFIDDKLRPGLKAQHVAVKFLDLESFQDRREWSAQVRFLGQLRHQHLVKFIGYCDEGGHLILVFEYMPHGRLENQLFNRFSAPLPWSTRMKIALGLASGLAFLHEAKTQLIYRDFRASSILLDSDYTAKLSSFEVAKGSPLGDRLHMAQFVMHIDYAAPEYITNGTLMKKSNVYSFGVVLLELLSGRRSMDKNRPCREYDLVQYARPILKDAQKLVQIMDPILEGQYSKAGARKVAALADQCLSLNPTKRPTMSTVVKTLEPLNDIKKEDQVKDVDKKVKEKNLHGQVSSLETSINGGNEVVFSFSDDQSEIIKPFTANEVVFSFSDDQSEIIKPFTAKMLDVGINVFSNVDNAHESRNQMDDNFSQAIDSSKICIPILSKQYLSSARCLHELAYIGEARKKSDVMQILPLFFNVDPYEVHLQYSKFMARHVDINDMLMVQQLQETLKEVAEIEGYEMKDKDFNKYINLIVNGIVNKLKLKHPTESFMRMEDQIKEIKKSLDIESGGVLFVGIHGTSGVGKTTLAKVIFNELADQFEGCSFLHNIREISENWGLKYLQDQLSRDIADGDINHEEISRMKDKLLNKKVLIVLDDVSQREQINNLIGKGSWFGSGSRIIVTMHDPRVLAVEHGTIDSILKWPKEVRTCELRSFMVHAPSLALQLFCRHAFGKDSPPDGYRDISVSLVDAIGGLPLALEIIGSFLNRKPENVWDSTLERLSQVPPLEFKEKLLISYESLEYEIKQIFLDIACFFCNKDKTYPVYMWDACNFFPREGLEVLTAMCLVKITDDNKLCMHDQVKDFGREMARMESFNMGLAQSSRLWVDEEALDVLRKKEVDVKDNMEVEALSIGYDESLLDWTFTNESFERTPHLRFLELQGAHLAGDFKNQLPNLRWLQWHCYPDYCEATNLQLFNLVILDLSRSHLSHKWGGWSQLQMSTKLKALNLTSCKSLYRTPDFSSYKVLERLILEDCTNLIGIDESVGLLEKLKYLNLNRCSSLNALLESMGKLGSLLNLEMDGTRVTEFLFEIGRLVKLKHLVLSSCCRLKHLPSTLGCLTLLVHLDLGRTKVTELPKFFESLKNLKVLKIEYSSITRISKVIGMLERLEELHARHCEDLHEVPDEIGELSNLRMMDLSFSKIFDLPQTIKQLSLLQTLRLESCDKLRILPELPESLIELSITLSQQPHMDRFRDITFAFGSTRYIPDWIGKLSKLETLEICMPNISELELHAMSQLRSLCLSCQDLELFPQFPASLSRLFLLDLNKRTELSTLGNLKKLSFLEFKDCSIENGLESLGVGQIESIEHLSATRCNFSSLNGLNLPKRLRLLCLSECEVLHELDLTGLVNLIHLDVRSCSKLKEIRGLGGLMCLEELSICSCDLLEKLGNLSNLEKLEEIKLNRCEKLKEVEGLDKIK